jgi:5-methylthioadenosine/S-adenosylhomocysteine deaminase
VSQRIDALICPRWTVTVEPDTTARENLCLAIDGGRIVALLPRQEALRQFDAAALHERPQHVLMPGLVNTHTHAAMCLLRGFADDMPLERWLHERVWPAEQRWVSAEFVADGTRLAIAEMLRGGITCFADMYFYPEAVAEVALQCQMRVAVGMIALDFKSAWAETPADYISKGLAMRDRFRGHPLFSTTFGPHAPYSVSDPTLKRIRQLADELEVPICIHLHETAAEIETALAQTGLRPLERLRRLGLLTPALVAIHATQLEPREIDALASAGASVVHCPRSNLKLASGACPVARLQRAGVNVALGTDGAASNNRLDLWAELETAALFGKFVAGDAAALPAPEVLRLATINGARALNLAEEIGSLEVGKSADVICVELDGPGLRPVLDPLSQLVYAASREQVSDVWVAGEHLVADRALTRMRVEEVLGRSDDWAERMAAG